MLRVRERVLRYGVAVAATITALFLMLALNPWLNTYQTPFLLFFGAVTVSAWYGGTNPGIASTLLSALLINYFFFGSSYKISFNLIENLRLLVFILQGFLISYFCGALLTAKEQTQYSLQQLQASEAKFRRLADANIVGIISANIHGAITDANDAFLNMMGYNREDLLSGRLRWDEMTPLDLQHLDLSALEELNTKGSHKPYEKAYIGKDGRRVPILVGSAILEDDSSENVISFILDLSDRKQAELKLEKQAKKLEKLNTALRRTATRLSQRNQELDRFAHVVSHDLKAPLRAIANLATWISEDLYGQIPPENQHQLDLLHNRVSRLEALVNGLLTYSRVGRSEVATEIVDLNELVSEILDSLSPPSSFVIQVQSHDKIFVKRLLLYQVLSNLIDNAIKHHHRPDGRLEISVTEDGEYYLFTVSDDGPGIAPEHHDRVFGIFETIKEENTKENTGIGLSIVKKIVETEGGEITLHSELGKGTSFCFTWLKQPSNLVDNINNTNT